MYKKFALFFFVTICLVQSFEASVSFREPRSINDIVDNIKRIIKEIEEAINELIHQLPEILKTLEDKIKEIISSINIDDIVNSIQDQVDEILKKFGVDPSDVRECVDNEKAAVKELVEDMAKGLSYCKEDAEEEVQELNDSFEELQKRAKKLIDDSLASMKQCFDENGANLIKVADCLKQHLASIKEDADALISQIVQTIKIANEKAIQVPLQLTKCVAGVQGEAIFKQKEIIDQFTKCVESHKQEEQ